MLKRRGKQGPAPWIAVTLAAMILLGLPATVADARHRGSPRVLMTTTGNHSELRETIPITRRPGAARRVVMSMAPVTVPDLAAGDRLKLTAELQVTVDCYKRVASCAGRPYLFNPRVRSRLVLANRRNATSGSGTVPVSDPRVVTCHATPLSPQRQHHCVLVFTGAFLRVDDPAKLPCAPGACFVNYVLDAHGRHAKPGDRLVIGANKPSGRIVQDRGRINAIRLRPASLSPTSTELTMQRLHRRVRLDETHTVILSRRLEGLQRGEQLDVLARFRANISKLRFGVRLTSHLILARSPSSTTPSAEVRTMATSRGQIAEANGSNCVRLLNPCPYSKVGILQMTRDATNPGGDPIPLYVNLVVVSNPKRTPSGRSKRFRISPHPSLRVARYAPSLRG